MADNIQVTAGSGITVIADSVNDGTFGGGIVQYVKLMDGTVDGTTKATVGSGGLNVTAGTTTGAAVPASAFYQAFDAATSLPTAATAGNLTGGMSDKYGRQVTLPITVRDLMAVQSASIATTSATTIISAISSVYTDIVALIISNVTTGSNTRVDISDGTNGFSLMSIAGAPPVGIPFMGAPIPATNSNVAWTATCSTASDIRVTAVYAKNK